MGLVKVAVALVALSFAFPVVSGHFDETTPDCTDGFIDTTSGNTDTSPIEIPPFGVNPEVKPQYYVKWNPGDSANVVGIYEETNFVDRLQTSERIERFTDCDETHTLNVADKKLAAIP